MEAEPDFARELCRAYLFADMSEEHLQALLRDARELQLRAGTDLFSHGTPAEYFYFVRDGLVKAVPALAAKATKKSSRS